MITASAQPYRVHSLNQAEQVSCNVNVIVLIFGYFFQLGIWSDTAIRAFATMCNVIIVVTIIVLLFYVALDTWQGVC
jgi:fumarate reductase subunit D